MWNKHIATMKEDKIQGTFHNKTLLGQVSDMEVAEKKKVMIIQVEFGRSRWCLK